MYKKSDNRTFNNTNNIYKNINQNTTEVVNTYKINKHLKLKKTYYNINDNVVIHKNNTIYTNDNRNVTKHNKLFNVTDNNYYAKEIEHTNNITNNITKHNHNNYEHNVMKTVNNHITHIKKYDTEINHYNTKVDTHIKHINNLYNDTFNFRKIENISLSQQTGILNHITETNNQTINYIDDNFLNNNRIATIEVNPVSELLVDRYIWTPETSDNVVPGLASLLTYLESQYVTLITLNNAVF